MRCPTCGNNIDKDELFCNNCGTAVDSERNAKKFDSDSDSYGQTDEDITENDAEYEQEEESIIPDTPHTVFLSKGGPSDKLPIILTAAIIITFIAVFSVGIIFGVRDAKEKKSTVSQSDSLSSATQDLNYLLKDYSAGKIEYAVYENYWLNISLNLPENFKKRLDIYEYEYEYEEKIIPDADIGFYAENGDGETVKIAFEKTEDDAKKYGDSYALNIQNEKATEEQDIFDESSIVDRGTVVTANELSFLRKDVIIRYKDASTLNIGVFTCKKDGYVCLICICAKTAEDVDGLFNLIKEA